MGKRTYISPLRAAHPTTARTDAGPTVLALLQYVHRGIRKDGSKSKGGHLDESRAPEELCGMHADRGGYV